MRKTNKEMKALAEKVVNELYEKHVELIKECLKVRKELELYEGVLELILENEGDNDGE